MELPPEGDPMAVDLGALCDDLLAESAVVEALVEPLDDAGWATPTPAPGWSIADQINHLAYFDRMARLAAQDPTDFTAQAEAMRADIAGAVEAVARQLRDRPGHEALAALRAERAALVAAARPMDPRTRVPWYGPAMTIGSSITARIMETWAHGVDVHDALGVPLVATDRLGHVACIGARALPNSFVAHGRPVPAATVRVELTAPDGTSWAYGPDDADETVTGPALDFCLLVVQRRHRADTALQAGGPVTDEWLSIAQAFAGPPGPGRTPGSAGAGAG